VLVHRRDLQGRLIRPNARRRIGGGQQNREGTRPGVGTGIIRSGISAAAADETSIVARAPDVPKASGGAAGRRPPRRRLLRSPGRDDLAARIATLGPRVT
jgi:hypothetical protein